MRLISAFLMIVLPLCSVLLVSPVASAKDAKMYKWTDDNGTVHYSTNPEDAQVAQEIQLRRGPIAPPPEAVTAAVSPEEVKRCAQLRKNLEILESNIADLQISEGGKVRAMTAAEREPQLKATRDAVKDCEAVPAPAE